MLVWVFQYVAQTKSRYNNNLNHFIWIQWLFITFSWAQLCYEHLALPVPGPDPLPLTDVRITRITPYNTTFRHLPRPSYRPSRSAMSTLPSVSSSTLESMASISAMVADWPRVMLSRYSHSHRTSRSTKLGSPDTLVSYTLPVTHLIRARSRSSDWIVD